MRSAAAFTSASMSRSCSGLNARWSSVTSQRWLMIVGMPGSAVTVPIVATPPRSIALSRAARPKRAAARKASLRRFIGVEPAWLALPVKVMLWRSTPKQPITAAAGLPASSRRGPCSMCSSR